MNKILFLASILLFNPVSCTSAAKIVAKPTEMVVISTSTLTPVPPTVTFTPVPPTATKTSTPTSTPIPKNRFIVPFSCNDYKKVFIGSYFDVDNTIGKIRNYNGESKGYSYYSTGTEDAHKGIDYHPISSSNPSELIIRAGADGIVIGAGKDFGNKISGYLFEGYVEIDHDKNTPRLGYITTYHHIIPIVKKGQIIKQGDPIGKLDLKEKRLVIHFDVWDKSGRFWNPSEHEWGIQVDLYRDLSNENSISLWTVDNDPQCFN
jgi:murein DD-endopeptidase MepM/ murein hydrolase activator NlpD